MGYDNVGYCDSCKKEFNYLLLHNGFNDSAYAYCDSCGKTAVLSGWSNQIPEGAPLKLHEKISVDLEPFLEGCDCGGRFTRAAKPRCPHCRVELSAEDVTNFIEKNAPGTAQGWRWQRDWDGLYCLAIKDHDISDNWK